MFHLHFPSLLSPNRIIYFAWKCSSIEHRKVDGHWSGSHVYISSSCSLLWQVIAAQVEDYFSLPDRKLLPSSCWCLLGRKISFCSLLEAFYSNWGRLMKKQWLFSCYFKIQVNAKKKKLPQLNPRSSILYLNCSFGIIEWRLGILNSEGEFWL